MSYQRSAVFISVAIVACSSVATSQTVAPVLDNAPARADAHFQYMSNRDPLAPSPFVKLPIGSITPKGWLRVQLENEANGMTGHLEELSSFCKFEGNAWVAADGKGEHGWEEVPY